MRAIDGKTFFSKLYEALMADRLMLGAASLAYYLTLSIFPAMIFFLSLLPYLPLPDLQGSILGLMEELLPSEAAQMFSNTVYEVLSQKRDGLLSVGAVLTLWAASTGVYAIIQQLNVTYGALESRPFWKVRLVSILLTCAFGALTLSALVTMLLGDQVGVWLQSTLQWEDAILVAFTALRWALVALALALAFALINTFGPDTKHRFQLFTPGGLVAVALIVVASLAFKLYVSRFADYNATYGSLGAVIILMFWLNIMGFVILLGAELNNMFAEDPAPAKKIPHTSKGTTMHPRNTMEDPKDLSYGVLIRDLALSTKNLVASEVELLNAEIRESRQKIQKHALQSLIFGFLVVLSLLPLLAFAVLALGNYLDGRYDLSALIVGVVMAAIGGPLAWRAYRKIKDEDWRMPETSVTLRQQKNLMHEKLNEMAHALGRRKYEFGE